MISLQAFGWDAANQTPSDPGRLGGVGQPTSTRCSRAGATYLTGDLISDLIRAEDDGDRLSADELRMLVAALLMAGTDTTRLQLGAAAHVLCDHPDQWALLGRHPELAANAVDELIRHSPMTFVTLRVAVADVEVAGVVIPAGTIVVVNTGAANRDPAVYDDPDRLDIQRAGRSADPDVRQRRALLPRSQPCPPRVGRGPDRHDAAHAQRPAHRSSPLETSDRAGRPHRPAARVRHRALNPAVPTGACVRAQAGVAT